MVDNEEGDMDSSGMEIFAPRMIYELDISVVDSGHLNIDRGFLEHPPSPTSSRNRVRRISIKHMTTMIYEWKLQFIL